mgnify:CR=1 FL=1
MALPGIRVRPIPSTSGDHELNQVFFAVVFWFVDLSGINGSLVSIGGGLTRFWSAWL